jgi:hypothetical protein
MNWRTVHKFGGRLVHLVASLSGYQKPVSHVEGTEDKSGTSALYALVQFIPTADMLVKVYLQPGSPTSTGGGTEGEGSELTLYQLVAMAS